MPRARRRSMPFAAPLEKNLETPLFTCKLACRAFFFSFFALRVHKVTNYTYVSEYDARNMMQGKQ